MDPWWAGSYCTTWLSNTLSTFSPWDALPKTKQYNCHRKETCTGMFFFIKKKQFHKHGIENPYANITYCYYHKMSLTSLPVHSLDMCLVWMDSNHGMNQGHRKCFIRTRLTCNSQISCETCSVVCPYLPRNPQPHWCTETQRERESSDQTRTKSYLPWGSNQLHVCHSLLDLFMLRTNDSSPFSIQRQGIYEQICHCIAHK